jgi:putative transposase
MQTRKQLRLQNYDYSCPGGYFVTVCTHERQELFNSEVVKDIISLTIFME